MCGKQKESSVPVYIPPIPFPNSISPPLLVLLIPLGLSLQGKLGIKIGQVGHQKWLKEKKSDDIYC